MQYLGKLDQAIKEIGQDMVEKWVRDLVIVKTFIGFKVQQVILKKVADNLGLSPLRLATSEEESQGIDGWLGEIPVSIKPESYKTKSSLQEGIQARIIYYTKTKSGITIDFDELQK